MCMNRNILHLCWRKGFGKRWVCITGLFLIIILHLKCSCSDIDNVVMVFMSPEAAQVQNHQLWRFVNISFIFLYAFLFLFIL